MNNNSLSDLTPVFFLQTFILELMHASEQQGQKHCEQLIEHIAKTAGCFFEETYREETHKTDLLDKESYTELILGLKNNIGGKFSLVSSNQDGITVTNSCCPFGDRVTNFPELCRMTSSVFGGIAARNFGYAKVEIKKSIARNDGKCEVCVYTNPNAAKDRPGLEYTDTTPVKAKQDINELHSRIEESMQQIWRKQGKQPAKKHQPPAIIAKSPTMQKILQAIEVIAPTLATVLIQGQTGVGKELIARAIHAMSERCLKPFIPINCGAIPESLIESALFGHEKGAFTGAIEVHQGYFERAEGGTLFLDEVDTLSPAAQTRLLRVIQEGELERVGGKQTLAVDVRIISATNQNLESLVSQEQFRNDLYYRLNVVRLSIPPLAERPEDLPFLVQLIVQRLSKKYNKTVESVSREVMRKIRAYPWPGNVRELENMLERSLLFTTGKEMTELDLPLPPKSNGLDDWKDIKEQALIRAERTFLENALKQHQGNIRKVAESMDITTRAVYSKLKKYEISATDYRHKIA
ncbi:MAG: Fis family transcriptional regulator [Gammaproteobacteria bacterium HGW-Gammaproteobacteria-3]|nr:MAG: Fis family transcriptional regulator [Gammaproteobacteria bacterium HGW-Gammaproteobacteria-3]